MAVAIVTGSAGLVGSACARLFDEQGMTVVGIDNDMRSHFFGDEASTAWNRRRLERTLREYRHYDLDVRDRDGVLALFAAFARDIECIVHAAAQPSHEWAARDPLLDFDVNAGATLTLLEATRRYCPEASFVFTSTNKVYGDTPNRLPLVEHETRWEIAPDHPYHEHGIDESMSVDRSNHSVFGASKLAADVMVQDYGRHFGMNTACFRAGCITGPAHAGSELHGFLSYLAKCALSGTAYTVYGYDGKQVRDNLHAADLASMFWHYCRAPRPGEVYNVGGGRQVNCSLREAVTLIERLTGRPMQLKLLDQPRKGDHQWYITDTRRFREHYPEWQMHHDLPTIVGEIVESLRTRV